MVVPAKSEVCYPETIEEAVAVSASGAAQVIRPGSALANLTAETAIFKLSN